MMDPRTYQLSDEEHNEIAERLKNELSEFTAPVKNPVAVILGGFTKTGSSTMN